MSKHLWQWALFLGVPLIAYVASLFWRPSLVEMILLVALWLTFGVVFPTWKQLDRIEHKVDAMQSEHSDERTERTKELDRILREHSDARQ